MSENSYGKIFAIEIEGWAYGIEKYPGEIYPELVHSVIRELKDSFHMAIRQQVAFDVCFIAKQFSKAAKYLVHEKELVFSILAQLPSPNQLSTEDEMYVLATILDKVEQVHNGAIARLEKKWQAEATRREAA